MNTSPPQTSDAQAPLADSCPLTVVDAARVFETLLSQVAALHDQGRLHRELSADQLLVDGKLGVRWATSVEPVTLGERSESSDACPPELQGSTGWIVPAEIESARAAFAAAGVDCDPRRIDLYQLGALLCRILTGQGVSAYLQSPRTRSQVPAPFRPMLDGALGYNVAQRFTDCEQLRAAFAAATAEAADEKKPTSFSDTSHYGSPGPEQNTPITTPPASSSQRATDNLEQLGHYKIICRIGGGGMGDVYKAYEESLDRYVAIKVLPPQLARHEDFVRRFHAEATAVAKLVHPNVVQIHAIGEDAGHHYFAMQFVNGESLADLLRRRPRLPVDETLTIIEQCLQGLAAAHRQDLIHRDVKPGNILLDHDSHRALLADFGLVKKIQSGATLTATGVVMGTVDYIPPEQARGLPVDGRADLYSLGVLMYQMLSGRLPFAADTPTGMIFQHAYETPKPLAEVAPEVPPPLAAMIARLLAKNPDDRYQSAADVLAEIAVYRSGKPAAAAGPSPAAPGELFSGSPRGTADTISFLKVGGESWQTRLLNLLRRRAPDLAGKLENTQQQVDGAVYEYEARRNRLAQLVRDAAEVTAALTVQAAEHRQAAEQAAQRVAAATDPAVAAQLEQEQADCEQVAADFTRQLAEQQAQNEQLQSQLAEVDGRLIALRSQRDVLRARLRAAQAQIQIEGGVRSSRPWKKAGFLIGCAVSAIALLWLASRTAHHEPKEVDLLALVDPVRNAVSGEWQMKKGELVAGSANFTRLEFPYEPPAEYDFEIVFTRMQGAGVRQMCVAGGRQFAWVMDAWGGWSGFEFDGKDEKENPTATNIRLVNTHRYRSVVKVRRDGVQAFLDGTLIAEWKTDYKDMSISAWKLRNPSALGIGAHASTVFHSVKVLEITGEGKRPAPWPALSETLATSSSRGQFKEVDLLKLVDTTRDALNGQWQIREDGALVSDIGHLSRIEFPYKPPDEYDYEIVFTQISGTDGIAQFCAAAGRQFDWRMDGWEKLSGFETIEGKALKENPTRVAQGLANRQRYTSVVKVRRDGVLAYLDGKLIDWWKTDYQDMDVGEWWGTGHAGLLGLGTNEASTIFHSVKVIEITGQGKQAVRSNHGLKEAGQQTQFPLGQWVDVLGLIDTSLDAVKGNWTRNGAEISCESDVDSRIELPLTLDGDYDLEIKFTRTEGTQDVNATFTVGPHQCMLVLNGYKKQGTGSGLEMVDGYLANNPLNPTSIRPDMLENGHRYRILLSVRRLSGGSASVDVSLDGKPYLPHWEGDPASLTMNSQWWAMPHADRFGLGAFFSGVTFHSVRLRMISRQATAEAAAAEMATPPLETGAAPSSLADAGINLLKPMSQADSWLLQTFEGAKGSLMANGDAMVFSVTETDGNEIHVQAKQYNIDLIDGKEYVLKFQVKASEPRKISLEMTALGDWHNVGLSETVSVEKEFKSLEFTFRANNVVPKGNLLVLELGQTKGTVTVKNMTLTAK